MNRLFGYSRILLFTCAVFAGDTKPPVFDSPETVVQAQVVAYNSHNIESFVQLYSNPSISASLKTGKELPSSHAELKSSMEAYLKANPKFGVTIVKRIIQGEFVIDQEADLANPKDLFTVIYQVKNGKIVKTWDIN